MKRFVLETKAALGSAPKTVDWDFDEKSSKLKAMEEGLSSYVSAREQMRVACQSLLTAMDSMAKALGTMTAAHGIPQSMRAVVTEYTEVVRKGTFVFLVDFKKAIDDDESTAEMLSLAAKCKSLAAKRKKVMNEYDTYREAVGKKEVEYKKKGKNLADSKYYEEEVTRRDSLRAEFEKVDSDFKSKYCEMEVRRLSSYMNAISVYLQCTLQLISSIEKELEVVKRNADMVNV
ncbi:hypothetical protein LSCM1_04580 [Leishmania martiniquensis]|uniref:BAR domain-containing protein n=1 Tax=Leishmania martiniquensis TaxID=1580590 RepID=A0A836GSJ1_9TRYP|nr:hypothetical protein LSCM1_04580 [Leishmania martiniquensis]